MTQDKWYGVFVASPRPTFIRISVLPASAFENLNSLETLNIQNNKLSRISEEVMEPIIDTLRVVDIVGKSYNFQINVTSLHFYQSSLNWLHVLIIDKRFPDKTHPINMFDLFIFLV